MIHSNSSDTLTGIERIRAKFTTNKPLKRKAIAPFVTAGDPDLMTTAELIQVMDKAGATLIELGVPYSDPIADGGVIQASYVRALGRGMTLDDLFEMIRNVSTKVSTPILAMVSYSIIYRKGIRTFVDEAAEAGLAGFIVPDLPIEESNELADASKQKGLALVRLVTPTTPPERAEIIARESTGFLYCVSVAGVTGARHSLPDGLIERVKWLRTKTDVPVLVGFGISSPSQAKAVASVADGVIIGSAIVKHLAGVTDSSRDDLKVSLEHYVKDLVKAVESVTD